MEDDCDQYELDIEVPIFIEIKNSTCATNDLGLLNNFLFICQILNNSSMCIKWIGAFSRMSLGADQFIGNYKGKIRKNLPQSANQEFVWPVNRFNLRVFLFKN